MCEEESFLVTGMDYRHDIIFLTRQIDRMYSDVKKKKKIDNTKHLGHRKKNVGPCKLSSFLKHKKKVLDYQDIVLVFPGNYSETVQCNSKEKKERNCIKMLVKRKFSSPAFVMDVVTLI